MGLLYRYLKAGQSDCEPTFIHNDDTEQNTVLVWVGMKVKLWNTDALLGQIMKVVIQTAFMLQ